MSDAADERDGVPPPSGAPPGPVATDPSTDARERPEEAAFGRPGTPLSRNNPFYVGFIGGIGALLAWFALQLVSALAPVLTLVGISAFIAMGLDPVVRALERRGLRRGWAVFVVITAVNVVAVVFIAVALPIVVTQLTALVQELPDYLRELGRSDVLRRVDEEYGVLTNASEQVRQRLTSGETVAQIVGGLLGAGRAVLSGLFSLVAVLVLTLYFLLSLNSIAESCYRLVPASRRDRVRLLSNEIIKGVGGYVAGQVTVAAINAALTYVLALVLGLPYALLLAMTVGLLGLVPLVGATIGAVLVVMVALSVSWQAAVAVAVYYVVYQQLENYVIAPRVMSRTVAVPGSIALIAALAGGSLLGILGALVAIPAAAAILLIIREVVLPRQERL